MTPDRYAIDHDRVPDYEQPRDRGIWGWLLALAVSAGLWWCLYKAVILLAE